MKRINIIFALAFLLAVAVSCSNKGSDKEQRERTVNDSIAKVEADKIKQQQEDSIRMEQQRKDSIEGERLKQLYANAITISIRNKRHGYVPNSEAPETTIECVVTNNTPIPIAASEYKITCTGWYPECSDGSIPDSPMQVQIASADLAPGESKTVSKREIGYSDLTKLKVKLAIPEEEFIRRAAASSVTSNLSE